MWSHYADKHAGICLGFRISPLPGDIESRDFILLKVNYIDKIIPLNFFQNKQISLFYWLFTKSEVWSYEEEIRAVSRNQTGLIPFAKSCLKEVAEK